MNRRMISIENDSAYAVRKTVAPTRARLTIMMVRRPMMSENPARNIAPSIMPASEKLKTSPSRSAPNCISSPIGFAVTDMAAISKPSMKLNRRHRPTMMNCCPVMLLWSMMSAILVFVSVTWLIPFDHEFSRTSESNIWREFQRLVVD